MTFWGTIDNIIERILQPLAVRTKEFLEEDMEIVINEFQEPVCSLKTVELKRNTAVIGIGGSARFMVAISYDDDLLDKLVEIFLEGEAINPLEKDEIYESVSMEVANTVIGNALRNPIDDSVLTITPPIYVYEAKSLTRSKNARTLVSTIQTQYGKLSLFAIYPDMMMDIKEL